MSVCRAWEAYEVCCQLEPIARGGQGSDALKQSKESIPATVYGSGSTAYIKHAQQLSTSVCHTLERCIDFACAWLLLCD